AALAAGDDRDDAPHAAPGTRLPVVETQVDAPLPLAIATALFDDREERRRLSWRQGRQRHRPLPRARSRESTKSGCLRRPARRPLRGAAPVAKLRRPGAAGRWPVSALAATCRRSARP